jgi:hypothetical protein
MNNNEEDCDGSSSSVGLTLEEIMEMKEKAIERERKQKAENAVARKKPAASAMPGGHQKNEDARPSEFQKEVAGYWQKEFSRQSASTLDLDTTSYDEDNKPASGGVDEKKAAKESAAGGGGGGGKARRKPHTKSKTKSVPQRESTASDNKDKNPAGDEDEKKAAKESAAAGGGKARRKPHTKSKTKSVRQVHAKQADTSDEAIVTAKEQLEIDGDATPKMVEQKESINSSPPRHESLPGAYAQAGIDANSDGEDSAVEEVMVALGDVEAGETGIALLSEPQSDLYVTAEMVDDAEPVFEAADVKHDHFRRNMLLTLLCGVLVIATVVTAVVLNSNDQDPTGDEICWPTTEKQSIPTRCYCKNSTGDFLETLGDIGQEAYDTQRTFQISNGILDPNVTFDPDSCDPLNQHMLITANLTVESEGFLERFSDEFKLHMFAFIYMYITMNGVKWLNPDDWLTEEVCSWFGLTCPFLDEVYEFAMPENGLSGTLPTYLGFLHSIRVMDLSDNENITGPIPSEMGKMESLRSLVMPDLALTGTIPTEFGEFVGSTTLK